MSKKVTLVRDFEPMRREVEAQPASEIVPTTSAETRRRYRRKRRERNKNRLPVARTKNGKFIGKPANDPCDRHADWPLTVYEQSQMLFDGQSTGNYVVPPRDTRKQSSTLNRVLCHNCRRYTNSGVTRVIVNFHGEELAERWCRECIANRDELEMEREIAKQVKQELRSGQKTEF